MTVHSDDDMYDVQLGLESVDVLMGGQVLLSFPSKHAHHIVPKLHDARLNAMGWEEHTIVAGDLQEGDRLPGLNLTVEYTLWFGINNTEIGVWADGRCVLTFRDPDHKIKVERKIQ
jgi:hypothetical protein